MSQTLFCWIWGLTQDVKRSRHLKTCLSQTLFCWIWGLTLLLAALICCQTQCHKPYFVGFEVWPLLPSYLYFFFLCHKPYFVGFEVWPRRNFFRFLHWWWCHKPYFVGFEVWPLLYNFKQLNLKSHKPYFVGFEVWPKGVGPETLMGEVTNLILLDLRSDQEELISIGSLNLTVSQTLFCWIWGLTFHGKLPF